MTNDVPNPTGHPFPLADMRLEGAEETGATESAAPEQGEDTQDEARLDKLPAFERDADRTVGAGVLDEGGTAIDRGTGTLAGGAQDRDEERVGGPAQDGSDGDPGRVDRDGIVPPPLGEE